MYVGSLSGSGRCPGEEHGNPFQYSHLENPMGRGAWLDYSPPSKKGQFDSSFLTTKSYE